MSPLYIANMSAVNCTEIIMMKSAAPKCVQIRVEDKMTTRSTVRPTVVQQVCGGGGGVTLILGGMGGGGGRGEWGGVEGGEEKACHQKPQKQNKKHPINTQTTTTATKKVAHLTPVQYLLLIADKVRHVGIR